MPETRQADASSLKEGNYVIFDNIACVVKNVQISRSGKHGHAKCRIEAVGIKGGQKIIKIMPGHEKVIIPIIEKKNAQVLSVRENIANVMDLETYETFDIMLPEELKGKVSEGNQVVYWIVLNDKIIKQVK